MFSRMLLLGFGRMVEWALAVAFTVALVVLVAGFLLAAALIAGVLIAVTLGIMALWRSSRR